MKYRVILKNPAKRFIRKLDDNMKKRIINKIRVLEKNPRIGIPLRGNMKSLWKIREGKYRMIYQVIQNELLIQVLDIGNRRNIYK